MSSPARGRPHGAAPTSPNGRGGPTPPHPALRATFPPVGGRQRAAEGGGPYEGRRGKSSTPSVSLRSTASLPLLSRFARHFPLTGGIGPRQRGSKRTPPAKSLPLTREVAFAEQMTEGETGRRGQAPAYIIRTIRRGAQRRPPRHSEAPEGPWESVLSHVGYGLPRRACGPPRNDGSRPTIRRGGPVCPPKTNRSVAPSSVICFANATFPPGGRYSASGMPRPTWSAPFVGAGVLTGPRAATWGRPYES